MNCLLCFSAKLLMDCVLLLVLMLAVCAGYATSTDNGTLSATTSSPTKYTSYMPMHNTREPTYKPNIVTLPPAVGRIKVKWEDPKPCQGYILFSTNFTKRAPYLCYSGIINNMVATELCKERRCGEVLDIKITDGAGKRGHTIHENLTMTTDSLCRNRIFLICKDAYRKELVAYKVITGFLLTLIIVVLLCRFAQPTYIAIHKRFSQKRQNRWIGPTQSQSVSYHRGQANHPNNNTMKRQSYPGLERLSVNPSREPSSNRNSDYDSYGG